MLLLKGDEGKSRVVEAILYGTDSVAIVYYDNQLPFSSLFLDSKTHSLNDLKRSVLQVNYETGKLNPDFVLDYIIIYTNILEDDLLGFIGWVNEHKNELKCRDVILACK